MAEELLSKQERDKRQVLATNLELLVSLKVLAILNIVRRIKKSRARGLNRLVTLNVGVGGDRNLRDLLKFRPDEKPDEKMDLASAVYRFLLLDDRVQFIEEHLLPRITDEDLTKMFEGWMSDEVPVEHRLTFDQITNTFDVDELWESVHHGLVMVDLIKTETHNMPSGVTPRWPAAEPPADEAAASAPEILEEDIEEEEDGAVDDADK